jgi:oxygen-dependent protoporphyrinogen oxidase
MCGIGLERRVRRGAQVIETRTDVAIVGGGVAGLTTAYRLARAGVDFQLLESTNHWGGLIRTEHAGGFVLDAGPDTLLAHRPEAIALCTELGLGSRLVPASSTPHPTRVVHRGRLHSLPEGMLLGVPARFAPLARTSLFSWTGKVRMALEVMAPRRRDGADESIASFFRRRLGQEALERIGDPLLAGIHAGDAERLSLRSTFPTLLEMEARHGSLIRAMWAASREPGPRRAMFFTLPGGLGELVDALVARLPPASLQGGVHIQSIERGHGFRLHRTDGRRIVARRLVLATPLWETSRLLAMAAPAAADALGSMRFASSATVFLGYRRTDVEHPLDGHGLVIPRGEGLRTRACTFSSSKYPGRAPEGCVLLKGYLGGLRGPEAMGLDDTVLTSAFEEEMRPLLGLQGSPLLSRVYRWPGASPQMEVGHDARRQALEQALAATPDVRVIGAGLRGSGVPNSVADGGRAAEQIISAVAAPPEPALA